MAFLYAQKMEADHGINGSTNGHAATLPSRAPIADGRLDESAILSQLKALHRKQPVTYDLCIHQMVRDRAHERPQALAVDAWDGQFTYKQLDALSTSFAAHLRHRGVGPEIFVPICSEKSRWVPVAILAVLKAGGAFTLLEISHPIARLQGMCRTLGATMVIASNRTAEIANQLAPEVFITGDNYSDQPTSVTVDVKPDNLAYAVFTSGSTGNPKAVAIEHRAFCSSAVAHAVAANLTAESRVLQFASYAFDSSVLENLTTLTVGACICIPSEEGRTGDLAGEVRRLQPNWAVLTPSVARIMEVADFCMLKTLVLAGEAVNGHDVHKWVPHVRLYVAYGVSEAAICNVVRLCSASDVDHANLGFQTGVDCWVVDPEDHDRLVPVGAAGELLLDGPAVGRGYIGDPVRTAEAFIDAPRWHSRLKPDAPKPARKLYKTGDLCACNPDGSIRYIGRKDHQKKFHGQRFELGEVEHNVQKLLPSARNLVADIVNIGELENLVVFVLERSQSSVQHDRSGESWLLAPGDDFRARARLVQEQLQGVVPQWMIPSVFLPLAYMPLVPGGKSDRKKLRSLAVTMTRHQLQSYSTSRTLKVKRVPSTAMEETLRKLWASVLRMPADEIGLDDDFTELGGTSIHAMKLAGAARQQGLKLAIRDVFRHGILAEMAALVKATLVEAATPIPPFSLVPATEDRATLLTRAVRVCQLQGKRDVEDIYPSTPLQEGLISLTPRNPQAYTVAFEYDLPASVDIQKFQQAWNAVMDANPILRTRFIQSGTGAVYQVVVRSRLTWESEADAKSASGDPSTWGEWKMGQPLSRFCLRRVDARHRGHKFYFLIHHAISEGWSIPLLLQQVQTAYDEGVPLPPRPFNPFIDYVIAARPNYEAFWTSYFADLQAAAFPPMPSSTYKPRPTGKKTFTIQVESPGTNEFSVPNRLRLAWSILISLYTNSTDTLFGLTVAGRGAPVFGIEDMTGPTIATIPCRFRLQLDGTVADALRKAQEDSVAMIPFEQAGLQHISRMSPEASSARSAFQSLLVIQPQLDDPPELFRASRHLASLGDFSTSAITLICQQAADSVEIDATFDPNIVNEIEFGRLLEQMRHIFQQLNFSQGDRTIRELDTTSPEDLAQLTAWNGTLPQPVRACAHDLIRKHAEVRPNSPAVCAWDGGFTYGEVESLSSNLAAYLITQDVGPEVFVPLCFEKSRWTTIAMLGVIKAGGAFILLDPSHPVQRLRQICRHAKARVVISSERNVDLAHNLAPHPVVLNTHWKPWGSPGIPSSVPHAAVSPENSMYAVFTSEPTASLKGATHSHISWCTSAQANRAALCLEPTSRVFQFASYASDISIADNLLTLLAGGCICVPRSEEIYGGNLIEAINDLDANWACLTPSVARNIDPVKVPALKTLALCGETMANEFISLWSPRARLLNLYNPAECAILTTLHRNVRDYRDPDNIGFPTSAVCWVVDIENEHRLVPIGTVGRLLVESPTVAGGYLHDPELTAESFIASGECPTWLSKFRPHGSSRLYRTGDLVRYTADGSLRYVNRIDTPIKLHGQRIELREVEYHLRQRFPEAQEAVVEIMGTSQGSRGPALTAFILLRPQIFKMSDQRFQALAAEASAELELFLPPYMIPAVFIPVDQLPYSKSGKLDRKLLRTLAAEVYSDEAIKPTGPKKVMPVSDEEHILHDLLARVLKVPARDLSTAENFVKLGCDSIVTMKLVSMARDLGLIFSAIEVFKNPTISSLAKIVRRYTNGIDDRIQPLSLLRSDMVRDQVKADAMDICCVDEDQIEDIYPCTPLQEGLISLSAKASGMYVASFRYIIPRETDLARYKNAWNEVLRANSILRTRIIQSTDDSAFQVVLKSLPSWEFYDTVDEQEKHSRSYSMAVGSQLVYLSLAPAADGSGRHHFLLTIHHSLHDGRSFMLLRDQVLDAYKGQELSPPPFNRFIRHVMQVEGNEEFWKSQMSDLNAAQFPALPYVDYSPNPVRFFSHSVTGLPSSKSEYTITNMIQLAWALVLSHYTDSDDVVFGLTFDGRSADVDGVMEMTGPTIATVPFRIRLNLEKTVEALLLGLRQQTIEMIPFLQYGLHNIRKIDENTAKSCSFQTQLVVQPPSFTSDMKFGELAVVEQEEDLNYKGFASYAFLMACHMQEDSNDLLISVNYDSDILQEQEARRMVEQFHGILHQLFEKQTDLIQEIEFASKEDIAQLALWNGQLPSGTNDTLHNLVLQHCRTRPDAEAVSGWDGVLTYSQLDDSSARLAQHLLTFGVQPESRVAVCLEKSRWSIVALLAVLRAGCACIIVDPGHPRRRIEQIMNRATPELMVVSEAYSKLADEFAGGVVYISASLIENLPSLTATLPVVAPNQAAIILFTSGSTGIPKGIIMEHINLSTSIAQAGEKMNYKSDSRCLHFASYAFDASIYEIFNTLGFGGCLCIVSETDRMNNLTAFINDQHINLALLTPSTTALLQPEDVPTLKTLITGGEALTHDVVNLWAGKVLLINGYGPAETTICCAGIVPSTGWKFGSIGHMIGGAGWIVDRSNHSKLAAIGAIGELVIEGAVVTREYLNEPEKTAAAYIETPPWLWNFRSKKTAGRLYKSGDLAQYNLDGSIRIVGRMQGQVKLRGQRIELGEVEYNVRKYFPVVCDVVAEVIRPSGEGRRPFLVACVLVGEQTQDDTENLFHEPTSSFREMAHKAKLEISNLLPSYMVPEVFLPLRRLPMGRTGKLDRRGLREACSLLSPDQIHDYSTEVKVAKRAPTTGVEKTLRRIWARVLNLEEGYIGVDDNWIGLGGDSILAMRVVAQAAAAGLKTSVEALFQGKNIARMSLRTEYIHSKPMLSAEPLNSPFGLSPIQELFFEMAGSHYNHFSQSFQFQLSKEVPSKTIEGVVRWIVENHSMLRARFVEKSTGRWEQMVTDHVDQSYSYRESKVKSLGDAASLLQYDQECLDIQKGPLLICHVFHCGAENQSYIAFAAHHLVVDVESWKILLSDFERLFTGRQTPLPSSMPFQTWSQLQAEYAAKNPHSVGALLNFMSEVPEDYWEFDLRNNHWEDAIEDGFMLTEEETHALLGNANNAFGTKPVEILHAALLQAFTHIFSDRPVPTIFGEGHGRDSWVPNLDVSRTVGWFATMWPVDVPVQPEDSFLDIVRRTKDARRGVKNNGWAFAKSEGDYTDGTNAFSTQRPIEIVFSYDTGFAEDKTSIMLPLASTPHEFSYIAPQVMRLSLVDVRAEVRDSRLHFSFFHNRQMRHRQSSIRDWIGQTRRCLESASTILAAQSPSLTVSDFPLLKYSWSEMEALNKTIVQSLLARSLEIEDAYKCSPIQDGIMLSQAKEAGLYMNKLMCQVKSRDGSRVHPERLQAAWKKVMARHPVLRAVLYESPSRDGHYNQLVLKTAPPDMSVILPASFDPVGALEGYQFDISPLGPQHRLAICASPDGHVHFLLHIHHALIDGYSQQLFLRDLGLAYGNNLDVTPVTAYRDYVEYIGTQSRSEAMAYWKRYLTSVESCNLPSSPPYPVPDKAEAVRRVREFPLPSSKLLPDFCAQHELTPANVFQLAWALVLRLYLHSESACFGYLVSGRDVPIGDIHDTVGPILNMHICHIAMEADESILNLLRKCQANYIESLAYQHISMLDKIKSTKTSASALFNTIMSVLPRVDEFDQQSTLVFEESDNANLTEYDVALHVAMGQHEIKFVLEYSPAFMSDEQVENMADAFQQAVLSITSESQQTVKDVTLFGELSKRRVTQYNQHETPAVDDFVDKLIEKQCLAQPSATAVDAWDGSFTYGDMNKLSDVLAAELRRRGVGPNQKVPICFHRSRWTPVAMLGVMKSGAAFILLETSHPVDRLREICADAEPSIILASEPKRALAAQLCSQVLLVDERVTTWDVRESPPEQQTRSTKDLVYLIFTSGSSGKPKGVMISHRSLATSTIAHGNAYLLNTNSRVLQFASYAFDMNLLEHVTSLVMGACVCIPSDAQRHDIPKSVSTFQVNWAIFTPAVARVLDPSQLKTIRTIVLGGEAVTTTEMDVWREHVRLFNGYGPTECTIIFTEKLITKDTTEGRNLGRIFACSGWVVNPNRPDQLLPVGAIGELLIEGPIVGAGYLNDPAKTAAAFIKPPPWLIEFRGKSTGNVYRTGDLVRHIDNGEIQYIGRKDLQVKLRGNRIELGEVESHLRLCFPDTQDIIAEIVKPEGDNRQPMLVAFVCKNDSSQEEAVEIVDDTPETMFEAPSPEFSFQSQLADAEMSKSLPVYMVPAVYLPLRYMPLTRNAKVDRKKIRAVAALLSPQQLEQYDFSTNVTGAPTTTEEILLQRKWAQVLNKDASSIGLHSNFFRMGGDSVLAMSLISHIRDAGYSIKMADIFNHPKLANQAAVLVQTAASTVSALAPFSLMSGKASKESLVNLAATQCGLSTSAIEDVYPTTPLQEGLVALAAKRPGQYITIAKYELSEDVDVDSFVAAWDLTVAANAILRTRVIQSDSLGFLQVVVRDSVPWETFDDAEAYEAHIKATIASMSLGDPLVHFGLSKHKGTSRKESTFYLAIHHALYDGGSIALLWEQVESAYHGNQLSPRPFNRFIEHMLTAEGAGEFWKREFEGQNAAIFPSLPSPSYIPNPSSSLMYTLAAVEHQAADYTITTVIRLAWAIVMSCYTDTDDVIYGMTVNGRSAPMAGIENVTGPTFATFPVSTRIRQSQTIQEALASIHEKTVATMPFQQFGIRNIRQLTEDAARACDFQCQLAIQAPRHNVGSRLVKYNQDANQDYRDFASYAFVMICHLPNDGENAIRVSLNYDRDIVHPSEATRMVQQFEHVLRQIELSQGNPDSKTMRICELDMLSPQDRQQLATWNSMVPAPVDACLHELVLSHAIDRPGALAISAWDGEMTFKELDSASAILAQQLQSIGVQPKSLVPLLFDRSKWVIVAMTALHRIGAACVNVDPGHPKSRIQDIVTHTAARFILTSPSYRKAMVFEGTTLITVPIKGQQPKAEDFSAPPVSPHDVAFVIFTSGSTGKPKGILMEHGNLAASIRGYTPNSYLDQDTRGLHFASYAFDASIYEIFGVLLNGGCICIPSESDRMNNLTPFINKHGVNWAIFTPSYLTLLEPDSIPTIRTIMLGGEAVTQENVTTWAGKVNLLNGYGPAEATICAVGALPPSGWEQGTIGHVTGGVGWVTMPSDRSRLAPIGTPGELVIEGAVVTPGYLGDQDKTAAAYLTDPVWLRSFRQGPRGSRVYYSGDIVRYNVDGTIRYLGRADNQVKLRGQRIELGEVEHHVRNAFPNVTDVVAEVVKPDGGNPILVAFVANMVEPPSGAPSSLFHPPSEEFLAQAGAATQMIRRTAPRYMVPSVFIPLSEIPRNSSDKANRRLLRDEAANLSQDEIQVFAKGRVTTRRPHTEEEKTLQSLWAKTFKVPEDDIGADDNFLNIGDSFAAIRLSSVARSHGLHLPVAQIFQFPILSEQARVVTALESTNPETEYKPGFWLGGTNVVDFFNRHLSGKAPSYKAHDVEDIIPSTERQSALIKDKNISYGRVHVSTRVDPRRLETACRSLLRKHAIFRTVFVPHQDEIFQVVLRDPAFDFKQIHHDGDLWEYSNALCYQDASRGVPFGSLHFQAVLISRSESDHMFVLRMTHAQYDVGSIHLVVGDLASAYDGAQLQSDAPSFAQFVHYRLSQDLSGVHKFWREYLDGSRMVSIEMLGLTPPNKAGVEVAVKPLRKIPLPTVPGGITMASLSKAAWSVVLARATNTKDVVFGHVLNGRAISLEGVDRISGPCITLSPFRASMQPTWTIMDLLNHVQSQHTRSMPYSNLDVKSIVQNATPWSPDTDFGSVLTHQDGSVAPTGSMADASAWQWQFENVGILPHFHVVTSPASDGLWITASISNHKLHPDDVDHLIDEFCRVILRFSEDASQPLPLEPDALSDGAIPWLSAPTSIVLRPGHVWQ
ncbi:hypothetical protein F4861DRAFT_269335 [Xylaria intraflava]|nr:hypothetical protein F4861DRAFT_269335 [Xylaria intraflava]